VANFGAHTYYRVVIDSMNPVLDNYWNFTGITPMLGSELLPDYVIPSIDSNRALDLTGRKLVHNVDVADMIFTTGGSSGWVDCFKSDLGSGGSGDRWYSGNLGIHGTFQLPSAIHLPQWYIMGGQRTGYGSGSAQVTGMSFYYSDNGIDWTFIKSFTDAGGLFQDTNRPNRLFILDEVYISNAVSGTQELNSINLHNKYITVLNALDECYLTKSLSGSSSIPSSPISNTYAYLGDLEWRLSGGVANTDAEQSLGGAMSDHVVHSQILHPLVTISGITIVAGSGNPQGKGSLQLIAHGNSLWLDWTPSGGLDGGIVEIKYSGRYTLFSGVGTLDGYICVEVDFNSLDSEGTYPIYVDNGVEEILDNVPASESDTETIVYRCLYLHNTHATAPLKDIYLYLRLETYSDSTVEFGLHYLGIGGEPDIIADEFTAPASVVFDAPDKDNPLVVGTLIANQKIAVWLKRTIKANTFRDTPNDLTIITYGVSTL